MHAVTAVYCDHLWPARNMLKTSCEGRVFGPELVILPGQEQAGRRSTIPDNHVVCDIGHTT
jgi:hypothetical protein